MVKYSIFFVLGLWDYLISLFVYVDIGDGTGETSGFAGELYRKTLHGEQHAEFAGLLFKLLGIIPNTSDFNKLLYSVFKFLVGVSEFLFCIIFS